MCIICKLINNQIPVLKVYEDEKYFAFLDITPSSVGHTLVSPKKHVAHLFELSQPEIGEIFKVVEKICEKIKSSELKPDGFNIGVNSGRASGQEINHLHIHIIPRWENDGGGAMQSIIKNPPIEDLEKILEKIKM